jgi:hypothetical protein
MAKTAAEKLADLEKKAAQIKAQMQAVKARERQVERKAETRRKIIIGGLLITDALKKPRSAKALLELIDGLVSRDVDKAVLAPLVQQLRDVVAAADEKAVPVEGA